MGLRSLGRGRDQGEGEEFEGAVEVEGVKVWPQENQAERMLLFVNWLVDFRVSLPPCLPLPASPSPSLSPLPAFLSCFCSLLLIA
ncbi:hypothetical protein E2C01_097201 [Portunus trituberculatus]|uniref:Uncharacterized protein n=1 Tax=Portunus trituberculatus TaxID=210409 RepID=A0A5B7JZU7_PORTR|nr:hypothetical protein [Portunus trituberculatus]